MPDADDSEDANSSEGIQIRFEIVGPIKSSTLEQQHPDPEWEALSDVLYWSYCCRLQARRLQRSFIAQFPIGGRLFAFQRKLSLTTSFDEHSFVVAAGN